LFGFFIWWFDYAPSLIVYVGEKSVAKIFSFFSIDLLAKTLFLPWKRDEIDTSNMALDDKLRVMVMNLISRLVGAIIRFVTIIFGLGAITGVILAATIFLLIFILSPVVAIGLIFVSIFV
jgi:hypothetical protein